jgi:hypothetical protein
MHRAVRKLRKDQTLARIAAVARELRRWDPLAVADIAPEDEYDAYAPPIVTIVDEGANPWRIAQHLATLQTEHFGVSPTPAENLKVATGIVGALSLLPK